MATVTPSAPHTEASNETLERARAVFREMQQEYASGNFARYGELLQQLGKLLLPQ
jgi:DNA-binding GntR family transcriptional regulator